MRLGKAQCRALEGIDMLASPVTGGASMATLRANGNRAEVVRRLCSLGLAYAAGQYGDPDNEYFKLTSEGEDALNQLTD